ncbi:cytochrome c1 [Wenzhouxiangella sp. EGI_FJ10409]|uniref:cytochrome c1 n=1 Tax=Wenzhouxiangella sp. EGI_FJ10409 TaxID=3243767 RepID=UPI0035E3432B
MRLRNILAAAALLASGLASAAGGGEDLEHANINVHDKASLQRGAAMYVNYCLGCHSMQYLRYNRLVEDLGLSEEQVDKFLVQGDQEVADPMLSAMSAEAGEEWFGIAPPDLTLTARSRGADWIYSYLKSFYLTDEGWNNTVLPNASMPHVLWELQGIQRPITESYTDDDGIEHSEVVDLELDEEGKLSPEAYSDHMRDLVAFMSYAAEPAVLKREKIGIWVLLFLVAFTCLAWLLYQEFWKDVKK